MVDTVGFAGSPDGMGKITVDLTYSFHFINKSNAAYAKHCKKLDT
jgi:hypothetical protein